MSASGTATGFAADIARARDLHRAGRIAEAKTLYRRILAHEPANVAVLHLLGLAEFLSDRAAEAIDLIERAIARDETLAVLWRDLAAIRDAAGDRRNALSAVRRSLDLDAKDAEAWSLLGALALSDASSSLDESEAALTRALALDPNHEEAGGNLAIVFMRRGRWAEAESLLRKEMASRPNSPSAWHNMAYFLREQGRFGEGLEAIRRALSLRPGWRESVLVRASLHEEIGETDEGIAIYRKLIAANPEDAEARFSLGCALLAKGEFPEGWREYEWRWRRSEMKAARRDFGVPQWDGFPLDGRTILLHAEQGIGDAIQFLRYAPMVKAAGAGRAILECEKKLHALFGSAGGVDDFVAKGEPLPPFDCHAPLGSLPLAFKTEAATIPAPTRYLAADPARVAAWSARLAPLPRPRVGLCWQGSPSYKADRRRSPPLSALAPMLNESLGGFISLHKGSGESQIATSGAGDRLAVFPDMDGDGPAFADTAAIIENLDLVIASDTSIAHLAAALGRPTWTMLPFAPDWRWQSRREDSPWYPTMRLFRQRASGDWADVVARLSRALTDMAKGAPG